MRKAKPKKRVILPDPVFNDVKVSKFVNHLMYDGKKNTVRNLLCRFGDSEEQDAERREKRS